MGDKSDSDDLDNPDRHDSQKNSHGTSYEEAVSQSSRSSGCTNDLLRAVLSRGASEHEMNERGADTTRIKRGSEQDEPCSEDLELRKSSQSRHSFSDGAVDAGGRLHSSDSHS